MITILYIIISVLCMYGALDAIRKTDEYGELDSKKRAVVYAAAVAFGLLWPASVLLLCIHGMVVTVKEELKR